MGIISMKYWGRCTIDPGQSKSSEGEPYLSTPSFNIGVFKSLKEKLILNIDGLHYFLLKMVSSLETCCSF